MAIKTAAVKERQQLAETPTRLIAAALRLFAEKGFEAVSLREITAAADANIAAVNYHFGTRDGLVAAVLESQVAPLNTERLKRLDLLEREHGSHPVPVLDLVEAFLAPMFAGIHASAQTEKIFLQFMGRAMTEHGYGLPESVMPQFREVAERFSSALSRALPGVGIAEIFWRLHFSAAVMAHTLVHGQTLKQISAGLADDPSPAEKLRRIVAFCAAGFAEGGNPANSASVIEAKKPAKVREAEPTEVQGEFF